MNINILQKCVVELQKESFSKEYVLGMLETLIEINKPLTPIAGSGLSVPIPMPVTGFMAPTEPAPIKSDEELFLEQYERGIKG